GLALSTHPISILLVFGVVLFLLVRRHKFSGALLVLCLFALLSGVSLYAYLPVRSHQVYAAGADRTLLLGIPPGRPFWDYDHPASRSGFLKLVTGSDFDVGEGIGAIFTPQTYFSKGGTYALAFWNEFGVLGVLLFVAGAAITTRRDPPLAVGLFLCGFVAVPFALGFHAEADIGRYFLPSFVVSAVLIGIGAAEIGRLRGTTNGSPIFAALRKSAVPLFVAVAALAQLSAHRSIFQQREEGGATAFLASVKRFTPPNAILVSPWLYATPLAYGIYVDHTLDDRIVETAWLSEDVSMIPRWMKERPVIVVGAQSATVPGVELREIAGSDPALYRLVGRRRK
ncbi:MAG: hypothetical protein M3Z14_02430, partial [Candidatus Eremiobacteraeota bacterium]|nr:hypothetical protein [Candidatus Eremiobacteraeota bacterium]